MFKKMYNTFYKIEIMRAKKIVRKTIAIIDADLLGRNKHRFPNLACEKISGYWKEKGAIVELKLDYENLDLFDDVFISKVFTDTPVCYNTSTIKRTVRDKP